MLQVQYEFETKISASVSKHIKLIKMEQEMMFMVYTYHCNLRAVILNHKAKSSYVNLNLFVRSWQSPWRAL